MWYCPRLLLLGERGGAVRRLFEIVVKKWRVARGRTVVAMGCFLKLVASPRRINLELEPLAILFPARYAVERGGTMDSRKRYRVTSEREREIEGKQAPANQARCDATPAKEYLRPPNTAWRLASKRKATGPPSAKPQRQDPASWGLKWAGGLYARLKVGSVALLYFRPLDASND